MAPEDIDIFVEVIHREQYQRQGTLLPGSDGPIMCQHLPKRLSIEQPCNRIVPRQVPDASLGFEQRLVHVRPGNSARSGAGSPEDRIVAGISLLFGDQRL